MIAVGVGQHQMWAAQFYKFAKPRTLLSSSGLGTMGFGLPAAMGVQSQFPDRLVIDIDGDGSFQMNIQELATCFCEKLPVKVLLLNNQHLGMVVQWEDRFMQGNRAHTYLGPIDNPEAVGKGDGLGPKRALPRLRHHRQGLRLRRGLRPQEGRSGAGARGNDRLRRPLRARRRSALPGARAADDPQRPHRAGHHHGVTARGRLRYTAGMGILIGMDEAGYGPNLGPLVVAATAWHVDDGEHGGFAAANGVSAVSLQHSVAGAGTAQLSQKSEISNQKSTFNLYRPLCNIVSRKPSDHRIAIADSKQLYKPGGGLRQLERGVHAVLLATRQSPTCWNELVAGCAADPDGHHQRLSWHDGFNCRLPVDATADELPRLRERLQRAAQTTGIRPLAIRARLVFPAEFNDLVEYYGSKGAALSHVTIRLLRETVDLARDAANADADSMYVVCDKHGGRNYYTALLQHHFPDHWIQPVYESRAESRYEWGPVHERMHVTFRTQGEEFLPTALASMTAKYFRELAMRAFNEFWCARVPALRPTAGYYVDASRFKRDIAATQQQLAIDDHVLWRNR